MDRLRARSQGLDSSQAVAKEYDVAVRTFTIGGAARLVVSARALFMTWIVLSCTGNRPACADKITTMLTARDLAHPIVLDADGQLASTANPGHGAATAATTPTYVAYALMGGEHLASDLTLLTASTGPTSTGTGPLELTPSLETSLSSALSASGSAIVQLGNQQYLVAYLPRYDGATSSASTSSSTASSTSSSSGGILGFNNINGVSFKQIDHYLSAGSNALTTLTTSAVNDLGKLLSINNAERSAKKPSLNLAVNSPSTDANTNVTPDAVVGTTSTQEAQILEIPAPEPSTWVLFSLLLLVGSCARRRSRNHPLAAYDRA